MMETQGTVAAPEIFDLRNDLIIVGFGTVSDLPKGSGPFAYNGG
jgi:hypothetical protein